MSKEIVKQRLHEVIDQLEDKHALEKLYAEALEFRNYWLDEDPITETQWEEIAEGLAQIRNDEPCTHQAAIEKFMEWQRKK